MKKILLLLFTIQGWLNTIEAQNTKIDSLLTLLKTAKKDTTKVNILNNLSIENYLINDYDKELKYAKDALTLAQKLNWKKGIAKAYLNIGDANRDKEDKGNALKNYYMSLKIYEEIGDKNRVATLHNSIGLIYMNQGIYPDALKQYFASLKMWEELGDKKGIAALHNNMGIIYDGMGNYTEALKEYFAALKICKEINYKKGIANAHNNIGTIYDYQRNCPDALKEYFASLKVREEIGDEKGIGNSHNNIGNIYKYQGNYTNALKEYFAALKIKEDIEDKDGIAASEINIGETKVKQQNAKEGKEWVLKGLKLAKEIDSKDWIKDGYHRLSEADSALGNGMEAYKNHKMYILYRDSLVNEENTKKTVQIQMKFDFDKKEAKTKAEQEKKDIIARKELQRQKLIRNSFISGFALVLLLAFMAVSGYRNKQKANKQLEEKNQTIEKQKEIVEEKQKEIVDSINYARLIQYTLLADEALLKSNLPEHFILFKPKDIVSGDFYWATKKDNRFYLAVCDSTGHGVPGAFMSVLNSSFLNEAINEKNIIQPHLILNYVRERLIMSVSADGGQDGMDCTLICIENNMEMITYASANNKPIHISNGELIELAANKMPVGKGERQDSFTSYQLTLQKNDTVYFFTDGFADQFGGASGAKKLTKKKFKELLFSIKEKSMQEQGIALDTFITDYRKDIEQIDDILVMGVRV